MKKLLTLLAVTSLGSTSIFADELSIAETAASMPEGFSTLTLALVKTDLTATLNNDGDFTVFAPDNAAFDAAAAELGGYADGQDLVLSLPKEALADILLYHVVPGNFDESAVIAAEGFTTANGDDFTIDLVNGPIIDGLGRSIPIVGTNVFAENGVIHVLGNVMLPPVTVEPVSIYETAVNAGLTYLVAAIDKAGLKSVLSSDYFNLTVFAPTNDAFDLVAKAALEDDSATGPDLVAALSARDLRKILLNHVLWGEYFSEDVLARSRFFTLAWGRLYRDGLTLSSRNGEATLVGGDFLDIEATNGVVHVIDGGVLLP